MKHKATIVTEYTLNVFVCGDEAMHTLPRPVEDGIGYQLTWGSPETVRLQAAAIISGFEYLLSGHISGKEAARRLAILRKEYRAALAAAPAAPADAGEKDRG